MTITAVLTPDQLRGVAQAASSIARLPAVPTQSWCADAGAAIQHIRPGAFVMVSILSIDDDAIPATTNVEATGGIAPAASAHQDDLSRVHGDGVSSPGWRISELLRGECMGASRLRDLSSSPAWPLTPAGKRWKRLGVSDLLVGAGCLHPEDPSRVIIAELGIGSDYPSYAQTDAIVFLPILEMLTARAASAFGFTCVTASTTVTAREEQILQLLTLGHSVREIAEHLRRSKHTVHDHVKSLHRKLGAKSRGALIARYLGHDVPLPVELSESVPTAAPAPTIITTVRPRLPAGA